MQCHLGRELDYWLTRTASGIPGPFAFSDGGEIDGNFYLFSFEAVEHLNDLVDGEPVFKILEDGGDGNARPRNTHAPLSLPGTLSTAGQVDQSRGIADLLC